MATRPAHAPKGRRRGHAYEPWKFLEQYEEWDEQETKLWHFDRPKTPFYKYLPTTFASGERCLNDYGFLWPPVPRFDDQNRPVLTYLVHARPPFELLWLCKTTCGLLGLERDQVRGKPAMDVLKPGEDLYQTEPEHAALATALARGEVPNNLGIVRSHLVHASGDRLPVELHIRYGTASETFYAQAHALGDLYEPTEHVQIGLFEPLSLGHPMSTTYDEHGEPLSTTFEFNGHTTERITRKLFDQWDQERGR